MRCHFLAFRLVLSTSASAGTDSRLILRETFDDATGKIVADAGGIGNVGTGNDAQLVHGSRPHRCASGLQVPGRSPPSLVLAAST